MSIRAAATYLVNSEAPCECDSSVGDAPCLNCAMNDLAKDWLRQNPELPEGAPHPNDEITDDVLKWFGFTLRPNSWIYTIPWTPDLLDEDYLITHSRYSWWLDNTMMDTVLEPKTAGDLDYLIGKVHRWLKVTRKSPTLLPTNSYEN